MRSSPIRSFQKAPASIVLVLSALLLLALIEPHMANARLRFMIDEDHAGFFLGAAPILVALSTALAAGQIIRNPQVSFLHVFSSCIALSAASLTAWQLVRLAGELAERSVYLALASSAAGGLVYSIIILIPPVVRSPALRRPVVALRFVSLVVVVWTACGLLMFLSSSEKRSDWYWALGALCLWIAFAGPAAMLLAWEAHASNKVVSSALPDSYNAAERNDLPDPRR